MIGDVHLIQGIGTHGIIFELWCSGQYMLIMIMVYTGGGAARRGVNYAYVHNGEVSRKIKTAVLLVFRPFLTLIPPVNGSYHIFLLP